jgi:hypothetical protein
MVLDCSLHVQNIKKTPVVAVKQGVMAEATIGGVNKTIDNIVNHSLFLIPK